jgi:hypothetical protein
LVLVDLDVFLRLVEQSQLLLVRPFIPLRVLVLLRFLVLLVLLSTLWLLVVVAVEAWALVVLADTGRMSLLKTLVAAHPQSHL